MILTPTNNVQIITAGIKTLNIFFLRLSLFWIVLYKKIITETNVVHKNRPIITEIITIAKNIIYPL